jgi:integrase
VAYAEKRVSTAKGSKGKVFWRSRYKRPDGTWGSEPGFPTKKTALAFGEEQEAAMRAGRWIDPDLMNVHFGVWARKWMAAKSPRGRTAGTRWDDLERHILPRWEHTPLRAFNWFEMEEWSKTLTCAENTVKRCMTLTSSILTGAVDAKYLLVNPLAGRRRSSVAGSASSGPQKGSDEEMWAPPEVLLRLAERLGPVHGLLVLATGFLGPRWGEIAGLHRDDALLLRRQHYDGGVFECPIVRINKELAEYTPRAKDGAKLKRLLQIEPTKNKWSVRDIDVPPFLAVLLEKHLADWPHPYVFCTPNGQWRRNSNWSRILRPAADGRLEREKRQGVTARDAWEPIMPGLTMRDLRHTHDTYQAQIGVKSRLAHEQAGHRYPGIKGVYQHPTPEMRQERLDGLQDLYERGMRNINLQTLWGS